MHNLNHPNWSGKPHRSREEAYGPTYWYYDLKETRKESNWWWVLAAICFVALMSLGLFA